VLPERGSAGIQCRELLREFCEESNDLGYGEVEDECCIVEIVIGGGENVEDFGENGRGIGMIGIDREPTGTGSLSEPIGFLIAGQRHANAQFDGQSDAQTEERCFSVALGLAGFGCCA
jgi:hypothetical protein